MKRNALRIADVEAALARKTGLKPGDRVVRVNGRPVQDELDFRFFTAGDRASLEVSYSSGDACRRIPVTGEESRQLSFAPMQTRRCRNRCLFCFVDQMPPGLRKTLYVKDEDIRFSFLYGNYVTLSSVTDGDLERIRRMRMSPLYVSVHATDPKVRNTLLGRKNSRDILETIDTLTRWGITLHTQVVLCPGINDGRVLEKTLRDLVRFHPGLASVAVVPVGLTRFRRTNHLAPLRAVGKMDSIRIIKKIEALKTEWAGVHPDPFLMLADEFYEKSGMDFPSIREYGDLPQLENGVGMIPFFLRQCEESRKKKRREVPVSETPGPFLVVTGELAAPHVRPYIRWMARKTGVTLNLVTVKNRFFGKRVNVAGLLTGHDVIRQVEEGGHRESVLLVPDVMLNPENGRFLDDVTLRDLERTLGGTVLSFPPDPEGFEKVLGNIAMAGVRKRKSDPMVD